MICFDTGVIGKAARGSTETGLLLFEKLSNCPMRPPAAEMLPVSTAYNRMAAEFARGFESLPAGHGAALRHQRPAVGSSNLLRARPAPRLEGAARERQERSVGGAPPRLRAGAGGRGEALPGRLGRARIAAEADPPKP